MIRTLLNLLAIFILFHVVSVFVNNFKCITYLFSIDTKNNQYILFQVTFCYTLPYKNKIPLSKKCNTKFNGIPYITIT